jgi:16S rRNA pseudouridine516 synthase
MRIDRFLSNAGYGSRSDVKKLISQKKVKVNDKIITSSSLKINENDEVYFDNQFVIPYHNVYIVMNKPKNYISATKDDKEETVISLINHRFSEKLSIAGRLDKDAHGLLILSNDGEYIHKVISPNKKVYKTYEITFEGELTDEKIKSLETGIDLGDFISKPAKIKILKENLLQVKICEGKYHQIKRMIDKIELNLLDLKRTAIGKITLNDLEEGSYKEIDYNEAQKALETEE